MIATIVAVLFTAVPAAALAAAPVPSIPATATVALTSMGGGASTTEAQKLPAQLPIGEPFFVELNNATQLAISAGYAAVPGAIVCVATTGASCAATAAVVAVITPFVQAAAVCPNNGIRRIGIQNYLLPARFGAQNEIAQYVVSNTCIPAR